MRLVGDERRVVQHLATTLLESNVVELVSVTSVDGPYRRAGNKVDCDVILLAIPCTDAAAAAVSAIAARNPRARMVVYGRTEVPSRLLDYIRHGVMGFIEPGCDAADLVAAIRTVSDGWAWLSPPTARQVLDLAVRHRLGSDGETTLTSRETEIADLAVAGMSNTDIAARLMVSQKTIKFHISNILRKYDVPSRARLVLAHRRTSRED